MNPVSKHRLRELLVHYGRSLFMRGYSNDGSGNLSVKLPDGGYLVTPINSCLDELDPVTLSRLDANGVHLSGDKPSKEVPVHLAWYRHRPSCGAVMHLHSPQLTALSCLPCSTPENCLPPLTPYYMIRVEQLPSLPYLKPGHEGITGTLSEIAADHTAALLANHGPIAGGRSLHEVVFNTEELEDSTRIWPTLKSLGYAPLSKEAVAELEHSRQT